jgi:membrane associated rhomboid family serine protease
VPVCYRHPDRETYIRCNRCERPICPDCMTSAAVGFQCPECVAEGKASVRPVRTRLGARVPTKPYVTYTLIGLCVIVFGLQTVVGSDEIARDYAMNPVYVTVADQYYRLVTSMFLHYGIVHIGFNMLVLWMLGPQIENVLGHVRFAVLYLVAGLGGSVASLYFSQPQVFSAGASGAIFGLMGAYLVVGRRLGADVRQVLVLIAINVVIGFVYPGTDWRAHLGGLVTGAVVAAVMAYAPTRARLVAEVAGVVAVLAVLALVVLARDAELSGLYTIVPA